MSHDKIVLGGFRDNWVVLGVFCLFLPCAGSSSLAGTCFLVYMGILLRKPFPNSYNLLVAFFARGLLHPP